MNEIRCPHCGKKLTGMALIAIRSALESNQVLDSAGSCPSCGKMIYEKDIVQGESEDKNED